MIRFDALHAGKFIVVLACGLMSAQAVAFAAEGELTVEDVWNAATARKAAIKNMKVTYDVSWQWFMDTINIKKDQLFLDPYSVVFAYKGERRYCRSTITQQSVTPEVVFDGEYSVKYRLGQALISEGKTNACEDIFYCVEFLGIPIRDDDKLREEGGGFYFPQCLHPPARVKDLLGPKDRWFVLPEQEDVDGAKCYILEYPRIHKLWVDPALGCAVRRRERYNPTDDGQQVIEARWSTSDYQEIAPGIALPMRCVREDYANLSNPSDLWGKKTLELHVDVKDVKVNELTDDDFRIELPAGTYVITEKGNYTIPGDKTEILNDFAALARESAAHAEKAGHVTLQRLLLILPISAAIIFFVGRYLKDRFDPKVQ